MFSLAYTTADLSSPPPGTLLVHACNCHGQLGAGVALAMKKSFPAAHDIYAQRCQDAGYDEQLRGQCFLIPPQTTDAESPEAKMQCWVACLLTSHGYGSKAVRGGSSPHPKKDGVELIKASTREALQSLRRQMEEEFAGGGSGTTDGKAYPEVWSNRMNAGFFGVEWSDTEAIIVEVFEGMEVTWTVVERGK